MRTEVQDNRVQFVDIAKGIAMICIILGHLGNETINRVVFTFHVPIFFLITGYFTTDKRSLSDFIKNKARTLIVPYYITCSVIIIIATIVGMITGNAKEAALNWIYASLYGSGNSYTEPFYIKSIGALWFLWATFWGSIFLRLSLCFNSLLRILFVLGLFVAGYLTRNLVWLPLSIQAGACAVLFMYMGFLFHKAKDVLKKIPEEIKIFALVLAMIIWFLFIINFKSFWLVSCDIGRGIVDIIGSLCACSIVLFISLYIENKTERFGKLLAYFGNYSLFILCVHIIELNLFPWWQITSNMVENGFPYLLQEPLIVIGKLTIDLFIAWALSKNTYIKKMFGYKS